MIIFFWWKSVYKKKKDFNIYIENTKLPSINLNIEYTNNGHKNNFVISLKGIDEIGTGTFHSMVLPCSFINKFTINDTIQVRNVSDGSITLISNYIKKATNGIFSIYKICIFLFLIAVNDMTFL